MEWNKKPCPYLKTVSRQVQNQEQTQELRLPEEMPDIGRVLCAWGQCLIRSKEWRGDGMSISGGVSASVIYMPEDGTSPRTMEAWLPFQMKWSLPQSQRNENLRAMCLLHSLDARILSARKMMLRAGISVLGEIYEPSEAEIYVPSEVPEDVELLTNVYPAVLPREIGEKTFTFEEDIRVPNVKQWISWRMEPEIGEQSVVGGRAILRGNGQLHYVYMDQEDTIHSGQQDIPFAQFIDLDREYDKDTTVDMMLAVSSLEPENTSDGVRIQCALTAQYLVWDRTLLEVVEDAYSPLRNMEMSTESLQLPMELDSRMEMIQAQSRFKEGTIKDVIFLPDHPNQFREGNMVNIGLSGTFQILYQDKDGNLQAELENWSEEMNLAAGVDTQLCATMQSISFPDSGMNVQVKLNLQTRANQEMTMITGVTLGQFQQPEADRPTLILRRMNEDSLWELAKGCGSTVDAIRKANGLTQEPDRGQMLLIPIR